MPGDVMAKENAQPEPDETPTDTDAAKQLNDELAVAARAEADQIKAKLAPVAQACGFYFRELLSSGTPDELARELVVDWHHFHFDPD